MGYKVPHATRLPEAKTIFGAGTYRYGCGTGLYCLLVTVVSVHGRADVSPVPAEGAQGVVFQIAI